jgi:O-methyltransferase involved in polyketide biosynthesis
MATLREVAAFRPGSILALSFLLPLELVDAEARPGLERAVQGARNSGTPFISFFTPEEILRMAREAGFRNAAHVSGAMLSERYFANRPDGMRLLNNAEELLVAST